MALNIKNIAHNLEGTERTEDIAINDDITFEQMLLNERTLQGLRNCGFKKPSPIQLKALPLGKCGFDLIVESKSGTGKTAVFGIIALEMLVLSVECQVIIISPTREIAFQIGQVLRGIGQAYEGLEVEVVMGGTSFKEDVERLRTKKFQILVGSPGRMKYLIKNKIIPLDTIRLLVLDEADQLMESLQDDINYIFSMLPERKQVIICSATYTEDLQHCLSLYMRTPSHICPYSTNILIGVNQLCSVIPSHLNSVRQNAIKFEELKKILSTVPYKQCLVFCNYQTRTSSTHKQLCESGWPSEYLSASQSQSERLNSLNKLQSFSCRVLVATDLAARGLDAPNVDLVINLDIPNNLSTYLHRIGRAGRYGSRGTAISILPKNHEVNFKAMFIQFGDTFEIKPLNKQNLTEASINKGSISLKTIESPLPDCKILSPTYDKSLMSLMTTSQASLKTITSFDEMMESLDLFSCDISSSTATFDSLLESLNDFENSCDNSIPPSTICDMLKSKLDILSHVNLLENVKKTEEVLNMNENGTTASNVHTYLQEIKTMNKNSLEKLNIHESGETLLNVDICSERMKTIDKNIPENLKIYKNGETSSSVNICSEGIKTTAMNINTKPVYKNVYLNTENFEFKSKKYVSKNTNTKNENSFKAVKRKTKPLPKKEKTECIMQPPISVRKQDKIPQAAACRQSEVHLNMTVAEYLQWKSHLSFITQCIQQAVYIETLTELCKK